jgi:2-methylcitrate dehydratase PrpD
MSAMPSPTLDLVAYSRDSRFGKLPGPVVDAAKRVILDIFGCMILGTTLPPGEVMGRYVASSAGAGPGTIVGRGPAVAAAHAALANGTAAHADELDCSIRTGGHPAAPSVAAALAVCEAAGAGGRDLINAVVLSLDVGTRIFVAMGRRKTWLATHHLHSSVCFALGAALAAGRVLDLGPDQLQYAMAIAGMSIQSPMALFDDATHMAKAFVHGQAAYAGVSGALLAQGGFQSTPGILETRHGLIDVWRTEDTDLAKLTDGLGERFAVLDAGFKYYSAGYPIHAPLHAVLGLMREHQLTAGDIAAVRVGLAPETAVTVDSSPTPSISVRDMLSVGAVCGGLSYRESHDPSLLERPEVQRFRSGIEIVPDPGLVVDGIERRASWVEVETGSETLRLDNQLPPGHWETGGMPWPDAEAKFRELAALRLPDAAVSEIVALVRDLDSLESVASLGSLLRPAS